MKLVLAGLTLLAVAAQGLAELLVHYHGRPPRAGIPRTLLVLGAKPGSELLKTRLNKAFELARLFPDARLLMSGNGATREIDFMREETRKAGLENRTSYESNSTTTYENLKNSLPLVSMPVLVVTNQFHLRRAHAIARKLKYDLVDQSTQAQDNPTSPLTFFRERAATLKAAAILLLERY